MQRITPPEFIIKLAVSTRVFPAAMIPLARSLSPTAFLTPSYDVPNLDRRLVV